MDYTVVKVSRAHLKWFDLSGFGGGISYVQVSHCRKWQLFKGIALWVNEFSWNGKRGFVSPSPPPSVPNVTITRVIFVELVEKTGLL